VPRHSVYYIVPRDPKVLAGLLTCLNSKEARQWLLAHCQRAANGFIRLQSGALKELPVPEFSGKWCPNTIPVPALRSCLASTRGLIGWLRK